MTRERLNAVLAAVLTTLVEVGGMSPASSIYLALGMDIDDYAQVSAIMHNAGLANVTATTITITAYGREIASKCVAALKVS